MLRPLRVAAALIAVLGATPPSVPTRFQRQPDQQPPTFQSGTQTVEVDVRVLDRSGRFITTLAKEDFQILEDGAPQQIDTLYLVTSGVVTAATAESASSTPKVNAPARHTTVFVLDTAHLSAGSLDRARKAVERFVKNDFRETDLAGIVVDGRMVNNRLTSTREELQKAVSAVRHAGGANRRRVELTQEWPRITDEIEAMRIAAGDRESLRTATRRACEDDPSACRMDVESIVREKAARLVAQIRAATLTTLNTLNVLCDGLARIPGPKAVIFMSDGFVLESLESQLRAAVRQAGRAGARFYTIDTRGLNRGSDTLTQSQAADSDVGVRFDTQADGTNSLAVDTGGMAIRNENNLDRALATVARDTGTYYVLGYRPLNGAADGRYRRVEVKVRGDGMIVRARRGYVALNVSTTQVRGVREVHEVPQVQGVPELSEIPAVSMAPETSPNPVVASDVGRIVPRTDGGGPAARMRPNANEMVRELARDTTSEHRAAADGWAAYERGDLENAARLLGQAAAEPGARPWIHYARGFALLGQRRQKEAADEWEQVRRDTPAFEPVYYDLADVYVQLGDETAAVSILRDAEKRWPASADVHNALGVIQVRRGALDDALDTFAKAVKAAPADSLGYFNLARAHHLRYFKSHRYHSTVRKWIGNERDREQAIAHFEKYVEMGGPYLQQARDALTTLGWK